MPKPLILYIDDIVPSLDIGYGYPRAYRLLEELVRNNFDVVLGVTHTSHFAPTAQPGVPDGIIDVICTRNPVHVSQWASQIGIVLVSRIKNLQMFGHGLRSLMPNVPLIYDAECITSIRDKIAMELFNIEYEAAHGLVASHDEFALIRTADVVITTSDAERELLEANGIRDVLVVGYFVDPPRSTPPFEHRNGAAMVGAFFGLLGGPPLFSPPNEDAVEHLIRQVVPHVSSVASMKIFIAGRGSDALRNVYGNHNQIEFVGYVPEVGAFLADKRIYIAPTRYCAGIPLKVIEAWSNGVPVVMSRVLSRQLKLDSALPSSDSPAEFAQLMIRLHNSKEFWLQTQEAGKSISDRVYSRRRFADGVGLALERALRSGAALERLQ